MNNDVNELPLIEELEKEYLSVVRGEDYVVIYVESLADFLPKYFRTSQYIIEFQVAGSLLADFNHHQVKIESPNSIFIFPSHVLHLTDVSADAKFYVLSFSQKFFNDMNLNVSSELVNNAYMRPVISMDEKQLSTCLNYLSLLEEIGNAKGVANTRSVSLSLVHSLISYLVGIYDSTFKERFALSRAEDIVGRYLSLVDHNCQSHHAIEWYALELFLTPKYVANVVKQVTGRSAGSFINEALLRKAKVMLLGTSLSIQQISDSLGFKNQSHFGTFFRRAEGVSPSTFRRNR